jgi:hypothetical protein
MSKMIGLARPLKIEWLNKTVDLLLEGKTIDAIKTELNSYLSFEIDTPTSLRKTRESLINIWALHSDEMNDVRKFALSLYPTLSSHLPLHWCMLLIKYPIFADICALIGKNSYIDETFTTAWIREKLYESWGERTSLDVPVKNILRTLVDFETLEKVKIGVYKTKTRPVKDEKTICLMIVSLLALRKKAYYEFSELNMAPLYFPFKYDVSLELLHNIPEISIGHYGGKTVVSHRE